MNPRQPDSPPPMKHRASRRQDPRRRFILVAVLVAAIIGGLLQLRPSPPEKVLATSDVLEPGSAPSSTAPSTTTTTVQINGVQYSIELEGFQTLTGRFSCRKKADLLAYRTETGQIFLYRQPGRRKPTVPEELLPAEAGLDLKMLGQSVRCDFAKLVDSGGDSHPIEVKSD